MKTIVVTAFGRFGNYVQNSTELVADAVDRQVIAGFRVRTMVFECAVPGHDRGRIILEEAEAADASAILCLGMASDKTGVCIETAAYNKIDSKYCPAVLNGRSIDSHYPCDFRFDLEMREWNLPAFVSRCGSEAVPVMEPSTDPGRFCCNHLMFQLHMLRIAGNLKTPFAFMHVPCSKESVADPEAHIVSGKRLMPVGEVVRGIRILLEGLVG